jgi:hypothetical protein
MDAMDEGGGGRGWEKLAPEERIKLRRDSQSKVKREPEAAASYVNGGDQGFAGFEESSLSR